MPRGRRQYFPATPEGDKTCTICVQVKSVLDFPKQKGSPDGLEAWCLPCKREKMRAYNEAYKARYPERRRQSAVRYQRANAERASKTVREKKYKMTMAEIEAMIEGQGGAC